MERLQGFEDLDVFRRAYRVSLEVHRASLEFPRIEQFALADQIRRASKSICANLAEGFGRRRRRFDALNGCGLLQGQAADRETPTRPDGVHDAVIRVHVRRDRDRGIARAVDHLLREVDGRAVEVTDEFRE